MIISNKGIALIRKFEGFSATPYQCSAGKWTLGFGSTYHPDGTPVSKNDKSVTIAQAVELLKATLGKYEDAVNAAVTVPLTQDQFDALTSLVYNIGATNFKNSTLVKLLNAGNYGAASVQFARWDRAGGVQLPGLANRRAAEAALFMGKA